MSLVLTYTKALRSSPNMINYLQSTLRTNTLNYYTYTSATNTLELTFRNPVDAQTKQVVDALVINYNEIQSMNLTLAEQSQYRFAQIVMATNTPIANVNTEVFFSTESYMDRSYFMTSPSRPYIYIQKPGTYLVMARLTTFLAENSHPTDTANVVYEIHYDDTRTEQGYITYPNSAVYTAHTIDSKQETTLLSCVFNCNPAQGSFLRIVARVIGGTGTVSLRGGFTSINIMSIANAAYFESVISSQLSIPTTFTNVFLGADRIVNFPFSRVQGQASTTSQAAGWLMLIARGTFIKTSGTDLTQGAIRFFSVGQGIPFAGTTGYSTVIMNGMKATSNFIGVIPVNAGTNVAMQASMFQGSGLQLSSLESGYIAVFFNATLYPQLSLLNSFTDVIQTTGPVLTDDLLYDLTFTTLRTLQPVAPNNTIIFSTATPEIIVNDTGVFFISAHISLTNDSINMGTINVRLATSVDGGITYVPIIGSNSMRTMNPLGRTSVLTTAIIPVSSGHRIKVQSAATNSMGDNVLFSDSCTLSLMKFSTSTLSISTSTFGSNFHVVISKEDMNLVSSNLTEKCRLVTQYIPAGVYRLSCRANVVLETNASLVRFHLSSSSPNGTTTTISERDIITTNHSFGSIEYVYLMEGVNTVMMQFSNIGGGGVLISAALIELWRT